VAGGVGFPCDSGTDVNSDGDSDGGGRAARAGGRAKRTASGSPPSSREAGGSVYFWNADTGETVLEPPPGAVPVIYLSVWVRVGKGEALLD
jgi:hypothetical protein